MKPTNKQIVKALKDCIKHWNKDIVAKLEKGDTITTDCLEVLVWESSNKQVKCWSNSCALCHLTGVNCSYCPLKECHYRNNGNPWGLFMKHHDLMSARFMVFTLEKHLKRYEKKLKRR